MAREIVWTPQAQEDYRTVVDYLLDTFGDEVAENYTDRLSNVLNSIVAMPQMGRQHPQLSAIRQVIMKPYTVICYLVLPEQLTVVNLLDSRSEQRQYTCNECNYYSNTAFGGLIDSQLKCIVIPAT